MVVFLTIQRQYAHNRQEAVSIIHGPIVSRLHFGLDKVFQKAREKYAGQKKMTRKKDGKITVVSHHFFLVIFVRTVRRKEKKRHRMISGGGWGRGGGKTHFLPYHLDVEKKTKKSRKIKRK